MLRWKKWKESKEEIEEGKLISCARYCFDSPEGRYLLSHLIDVCELDHQTGLVSGDESIYINGKQDMMKYILALLEENKGENNE